MPEPLPLYPVNRAYLEVLSDSIGIMQHAVGSRPDPAHGYCTDDVARALQVDLLHGRVLGWDAVADSAERYLGFLEAAFDEPSGRFRNFRRMDGSWVEEDRIASEDSHGRAMLALGETVAEAQDDGLAADAKILFDRALPAGRTLVALRARSSVLLGCAAVMKATSDASATVASRILSDRIRWAFESRLTSDWPWPESRLTYENALPARAMILAGRRLGSKELVTVGVRVLDWLIDVQTASDGHLSPIGNEWWPCGGVKSTFDQQPIEATALLLAAEAAYRSTGDDRYRATMERAYGWFLGENDLGLTLADPGSGGGCDGLTADGVNANQGAESTLMWLTALEHIRVLRQAGSLDDARPLALASTAS